MFRHELFIVSIEPQVLHQLRNVSKGDVPMALLPDPITAASERSSVKNRLTGSRRRGSGINRHRSRTVSKARLRGRHRVQAHPGGGAGPEPLQPAVKHEKLDKRSGAVCQAEHAAASRIVRRRFQ